MLIWVNPEELNWGCFLQSWCFYCTVLEDDSLTVHGLVLWGGWGWALRPCHSPSLKVDLLVCICICLKAYLAFYVCLVFCIAVSAVLLLSCVFPLDLILLIFNTAEMQWKLFSCKSFYFKARRLFRDYLIYPPAGSGCLCDIFFTLGL